MDIVDMRDYDANINHLLCYRSEDRNFYKGLEPDRDDDDDDEDRDYTIYDYAPAA